MDMAKYKKMLTAFLLGLFCFSAVISAGASEKNPDLNEHGIVTVLVLDKVTLGDLIEANVPNIMTMIDNGAVGLMTTNPAHGASRTSENINATIGAGAKIEAGYIGNFAFNEAESATETNTLAAREYEVRTGIEPPPGSVVHLGIAQIWNINEELKYDYVVGGLGTALHESGFKTAVLGNSDTREHFNRQAVTIVMDKDGMVDYGDVSIRILKKDENAVYGKKTDYNKLIQKYRELKTKADMVVIDLGDSARIDTAEEQLLPKVVVEKKNQVLKEADTFIGNICSEMDMATDLLILAVPSPPNSAMEEHNYLTPIVMAGKNVKQGILSSASTKRTGLINNTDLVPTILRHFGLPIHIPYYNSTVIPNGQPVQFEKVEEPLAFLTELNNDIVRTFNARYPLVKTFINSELVLILVFAFGILFNIRQIRYFRPLLIALTVMPLAMLLKYFFPSPTVVIYVMVVLGLTLVLTGLFYLIKKISGNKAETLFAVIGLLTASVIIIDLLTGGLLNKTSPFSYDPMAGARFYGIGNEYMGVIIGSLLMGLGNLPVVLNRFQKATFIFAMLLTVYVMAAPNLGTNVGGTIAALIGFGMTILLLLDIKPDFKVVAAAGVAMAVLFSGFLLYDMSRSVEAQSHIGRTMNLLVHGGADEALNIISRKWGVNWRLIRGTTWSWAYFSGLISIFVFWQWLRDKMERLRDTKPVYFKFLIGIIAASLAALIFNDSGVVAAAGIIIYAVVPLYYFLLEEKDDKGVS